MGNGFRISWFFSRSFLLSRGMLWPLFIINLLGTIYGYYWYKQQLINTAESMPGWYLPFVPDSPTASLFFTLSVIYMLWDSYGARNHEQRPLQATNTGPASALRGFIEAFAFVTSFKYGIWAVSIIVADSYMGSPVVWEDYMLSISHLAMAVEVLLYGRFYRYRWLTLALVSVWTFMNDYMDYHHGIMPTLSRQLLQYVDVVETYTITLSVIGIALALLYLVLRSRRKV